MVGRKSGHLEQSFGVLYDRTHERVYAFVRRRLYSEHEAPDVLSETYMNVWRRIRDVPSDPPLADAWVFATARRVLANHRRAAQRRGRLVERLEGEPLAPSASSTPDDDRLLRALARLPHRQREILEFVCWDELSHAQIARVLGCSDNAVAIRLHRARTALRDVYDQLAGERESA